MHSLKLSVVNFMILACFLSFGAATRWILSTFFLMWSLFFPASCAICAITFLFSSLLVAWDPGTLHHPVMTRHDL